MNLQETVCEGEDWIQLAKAYVISVINILRCEVPMAFLWTLLHSELVWSKITDVSEERTASMFTAKE
jgi:hypothetical protein